MHLAQDLGPLCQLVSPPLFTTCCPSLLQTYLSYLTALLKIYTSSPSSRHGSPFSLSIQLSFIKSKPILPSLCPKIHLLILAKTYQQWSTISTSKESIWIKLCQQQRAAYNAHNVEDNHHIWSSMALPQNCPCGTCKAQIPRPWCKSETWKDDLDKKNKNYITLNNGICISLQQHSVPASKLLKGVQRYLPFVNSQYPQTLRKYRTIPYRTFPHLPLTYQPDSVQPLPEMCLED